MPLGSLLPLLLYGGGGLIIVLVLLFMVLTAYIAYKHWQYSHFPSPERPSFYFGHLNDIWQLQKDIDKEMPFRAMIEYWAQKVESPTFVVFFFDQPLIMTLDPDLIKDVAMDKDNPKSKMSSLAMRTVFGKRFLGDGLLSEVHYDKWKLRRKLYDPAFNRTYLKTLVSTFNETTTSIIDNLKPLADGKIIVPLKNYIHNLTLDVISKVAFGSDFTEQWTAESLDIKLPGESNTNILYYIVGQSLKAIHQNIISVCPSLNQLTVTELSIRCQQVTIWNHDKGKLILMLQFIHPIEGRNYQKCILAMRKIGRDCIMKRIRMIQAGEEVPQDILSCMLSSNMENLKIEDLVDDFCTFYVAGQDTTANTLMFALILLFQHPNILERLQQEITEVLGDRTEVTNEDLDNLQFTDQVFSETLRLYPAAEGIYKTIEKPKVLGKYFFPAGAIVGLESASISRLPQYFDDPDSFNPDRFHPDNEKPNSFVYAPFGIGHRACIGKHLALMEGKIALARLLQTFKITFPPDYKITVMQRLVQQPKGDLLCTMKCN